MHLTTNADDTVKLSDLLAGHRSDLEKEISQIELSEGSQDLEQLAKLKGQLQKLSEQEAALNPEVT